MTIATKKILSAYITSPELYYDSEVFKNAKFLVFNTPNQAEGTSFGEIGFALIMVLELNDGENITYRNIPSAYSLTLDIDDTLYIYRIPDELDGINIFASINANTNLNLSPFEFEIYAVSSDATDDNIYDDTQYLREIVQQIRNDVNSVQTDIGLLKQNAISQNAVLGSLQAGVLANSTVIGIIGAIPTAGGSLILPEVVGGIFAPSQAALGASTALLGGSLLPIQLPNDIINLPKPSLPPSP